MSGPITTPYLTAPSSATRPLVVNGAGSYNYGNPTQLLTATGNVSVAGLLVTGAFSQGVSEFDIGIGPTSGTVVWKGWNIRVKLGNSGNGGPSVYLLRIPVLTGTVPGDILWTRSRGDNTFQIRVALLYHVDATFDVLAGTPTSSPIGAADAVVTPPGSAWDNSSYVTLLATFPTPILIMGVTLARPGAQSLTEWEADLAVTGAQTIIGTVQGINTSANRNTRNYLLPALYPLAAGQPVYVRLRQASTDTTAWGAALLFFGDFHISSGTIIVQKTTSPASMTLFPFTAGGGLSPTTFSLADAQERIFESVNVGSGYSVVEGAVADWSLNSITVSNGSPNTNLSVADGETVTVLFENIRAACPAPQPDVVGDGNPCPATVLP